MFEVYWKTVVVLDIIFMCKRCTVDIQLMLCRLVTKPMSVVVFLIW